MFLPNEKMTGDDDFDDVLRRCIDIMSTKGVDYKGGSEDRLNNFRQAAIDLGITMREVAYIYMWKHLAAIKSYCRTGEVKAEGLREHICDTINYLLILDKIEKDQKGPR
jgi:hypothetical protein